VGRGGASEAASAALAFGFDDAGLPEIVSFTTPANACGRGQHTFGTECVQGSDRRRITRASPVHTVSSMVPTAALPNLSDPSAVAFGAALGAFFANTVARLMRRGHATRLRWSVEGSHIGTAIALGAYLIGNAPHIIIF
jgi:hypothetical protein